MAYTSSKYDDKKEACGSLALSCMKFPIMRLCNFAQHEAPPFSTVGLYLRIKRTQYTTYLQEPILSWFKPFPGSLSVEDERLTNAETVSLAVDAKKVIKT